MARNPRGAKAGLRANLGGGGGGASATAGDRVGKAGGSGGGASTYLAPYSGGAADQSSISPLVIFLLSIQYFL